ncbi:MAG: hypothetical protein WKF87_03925 [Chryseolinea sp.]
MKNTSLIVKPEETLERESEKSGLTNQGSEMQRKLTFIKLSMEYAPL